MILFIKGTKLLYNLDTYAEAIYQCTDTNETYIFGQKANDIIDLSNTSTDLNTLVLDKLEIVYYAYAKGSSAVITNTPESTNGSFLLKVYKISPVTTYQDMYVSWTDNSISLFRRYYKDEVWSEWKEHIDLNARIESTRGNSPLNPLDFKSRGLNVGYSPNYDTYLGDIGEDDEYVHSGFIFNAYQSVVNLHLTGVANTTVYTIVGPSSVGHWFSYNKLSDFFIKGRRILNYNTLALCRIVSYNADTREITVDLTINPNEDWNDETVGFLNFTEDGTIIGGGSVSLNGSLVGNESLAGSSSAFGSIAFGDRCASIGDLTAAFNWQTIALNFGETALGISNKSHKGSSSDLQTLFSVGNGDDYCREESEYTLKNAFEIMNNGDVYVQGVGNYDGINDDFSAQTLQEVIGLVLNSKADVLDVVGMKNKSVTGAEVFNDYSNNKATGKYSHAEGFGTTASGNVSHAEGYHSEATGNHAHAEGYNTNASGQKAHAEGSSTQAVGSSSHSEGLDSFANGDYSHAEGYNTYAGSTASHAEGNGTQASGQSSHAEGLYANAIGNCSHAEGESTTAKGERSHAEGLETNAEGYSSHAEGCCTFAIGESSHAEGDSTLAQGKYSHSEGRNTEATNDFEHAEGRYNKSNEGTRHSVGIGSSGDDRKNAFEIMDDGRVFVFGVGNYDGTNTGAEGVQALHEVMGVFATQQEISNISTALENHKNNQDKKHIPGGGHERQILSWESEGTAKWEDLANVFTGLEEILAYGVQWNTTVSDPHLTRIGNMSLHKTLPIQSQLKGCIAQGNLVIYWLDENDWKWRKNPITLNMTLAVADGVYTIVDTLFADNRYKDQWLRINNIPCKVTAIDTGTTTATLTPDEAIEAGAYDVELGAVLNGYDGTVRVYCPNFYIKSYSDGNIRKVYISTVKIDDSWTYQHEILIDAYRCTVLNTVPENMGYLSTLPVNSTISVVNTEIYCRGGGNRSANDTYLTTDPFRTDLGKTRTSTTRANMRTYARNAGSELLSYEQYKNIFYWLWVIEYANFNSQEAYNEELTAEGYRQGGMGAGVTNCNGNYWNYYNGYYPLTPCGYGNDMGNNTGLKQMTITMPTVSGGEPTQILNFQMPRWRGFDNLFGDTLTNLDGVIVDADANNHGNNMDYVYTCNDPSKFGDTLTEDYVKIAESIHLDGYVKAFDLGETANIIASLVGGSTTTYMCDYHWTGDKNTTLRTVLVGGGAHHGAGAGLGSLASTDAVSGALPAFGFRSVSVLGS